MSGHNHFMSYCDHFLFGQESLDLSQGKILMKIPNAAHLYHGYALGWSSSPETSRRFTHSLNP